MRFSDSEQIYSPKSREYFKEVVSSFVNENYRSAIVMLYSVCVCDILYKLQELADMYNDKSARTLLSEIQKIKEVANSKSAWEKELIDKVYNKTNLLDLEAYTNLAHLYDYRNLCAHPALNDNLDLILPGEEIVAAYIRTSLDTILLKPAIFLKNVTDIMSSDLDEKRDYILMDKKEFKKYVINRYLSRMQNSLYVSTFQAFWKFTFRINDEKCNINREVNRRLLGVMYELRANLIDSWIDSNPSKFEFLPNEDICKHAILFLANHPTIYPHLDSSVKTQISTITTGNVDLRMISWFLSNKRAHLLDIVTQDIASSNKGLIKFLVDEYIKEGLKDDVLMTLIDLTGKAEAYVNAGHRIECYILPFLKEMSFKHFERIFSIISSVESFRGNYYMGTYCKKIWAYAEPTMPENFDMTKYPNFKVPEA